MATTVQWNRLTVNQKISCQGCVFLYTGSSHGVKQQLEFLNITFLFRFFGVLLVWFVLEPKHLNTTRTGWAAKPRARFGFAQCEKREKREQGNHLKMYLLFLPSRIFHPKRGVAYPVLSQSLP